MPSDKQLTANCLNAQKSTGPRTTAGKAASSGNALKTGLYSESLIIKGESAADLETLTAEYYVEHHPTTATERALVDTLVHNEWLLRRLRRVEADIWSKGIEFLEDSEFQPKNHLLADTFANKDERFLLLQRRIDSLDRAWHRALKALRQLQADRLQPTAPILDDQPVQPLAPQLVPPPIGFVPSPPAAASLPPLRPSSPQFTRRAGPYDTIYPVSSRRL
jgi:hypothetical protein